MTATKEPQAQGFQYQDIDGNDIRLLHIEQTPDPKEPQFSLKNLFTGGSTVLCGNLVHLGR